MDHPWKTQQHDPIQRLEDNLWNVDADIPGIPLRRRMVIVRRADGRLVVHNAVCVGEDALREIEAWGEPAFLVVPSGFHRIDASRWAARYPRATVLAPARSAKRVRERVRVDGSFDALPADPAVTLETLDGSKIGEGALAVRSGDRVSLVFNDTVMNNAHGRGLWWAVYRLIGSTGRPKVTPLIKLAGVNNRRALSAHLARLAETPGLVRVLPGHGAIIDRDAPRVLREVAAGV